MLRERYRGATFDVKEEPPTKKRRKKKPKSLTAANKVSLTGEREFVMMMGETRADYTTHERRAPIHDSVDPDELEEELCFDFEDVPSSSEPVQVVKHEYIIRGKKSFFAGSRSYPGAATILTDAAR